MRISMHTYTEKLTELQQQKPPVRARPLPLRALAETTEALRVDGRDTNAEQDRQQQQTSEK
jgi:hypothetical protein